jgi:hypothetical protein
MRDREVIEKEMYRAREDLEQNLAELKHVVTETVDIPARARVAVAKGKIAAQDAIERGKDKAVDMLARGKVAAGDALDRGRIHASNALDRSKTAASDAVDAAKARPVMTGAIIGGVVAAGVLIYVGRQRDWW